MDMTRPSPYDVSDYFGIIRRHWWVVMLGLLLGVVGGAGYAGTQPKVYQSTTSVLVLPIDSQDANATGGRTSATINLDTEAQLVTSTDNATAAGKLLKVSTPPDVLATDVSVTVPANTTVLDVAYEASSPGAARAGSHAFATAYLTSRQQSAQANLNTQVTALSAKVKQYATALSQLSGRVAGMANNDPNRAALNSQINTLTNQINTLTSRVNDLSTTTVTGGRVISDATLPATPVRPVVPLYLASGAVIGLLAGCCLAALRERTDKRLRRPGDLIRRADLPVLAELPKRTKPRFDDVFPAYGPAGRMFNRLRNEVLASLGPQDQVLVVAGASRGNAASLVAANLASALARTGSEVVLVCAQLPDSLADTTATTRLLGVPPVPGLSDILAGKVGLDEGLQRAPRNPWLRVITTGGTASSAGLLQSQLVRETLDDLRGEAEYLVVEAPSTSVSADAQSLASLADAAILAVEVRRSTHAEVADAAAQLRRVGTPLLGGVVLPKLKRLREERRPRTGPGPSAVDGRGTLPELPGPEYAGHRGRTARARSNGLPVGRGGARPERGDETVVMARVDYDRPPPDGRTGS
ncbi:MAG TPA: Wzz/FepE/Etk N-terminal domain-containing protein [Rugosimonospora sp.]|nr:Wzz/FepE/Etk N-terminal domain-containing protein [Rugosimonospora sp.]